MRFWISPSFELGRSMTSRGGESSVWTSGITGLVERISTAGTPRSWTIRTLLIVGGGPKVWATAATAPKTTAIVIRHTRWTAGRDKSFLIRSLKETYHLGWMREKRRKPGVRRRASALRRPPAALASECDVTVWNLKAVVRRPRADARRLPLCFRQELVLFDHGSDGEFALFARVLDAHHASFALHADAFGERDLGR